MRLVPVSRRSGAARGGLCLFAKRLERGRFVWPAAATGAAAALSPAQLSMLLEGIDWRAPVRTDRPLIAG